MMEQLSALALGIATSIYLEKEEFENDELHIYLDFCKGSKFACSICDAEGCAVYDTISKTWRHLNFFNISAFCTFTSQELSVKNVAFITFSQSGHVQKVDSQCFLRHLL
jgi:hypothetical protein